MIHTEALEQIKRGTEEVLTEEALVAKLARKTPLPYQTRTSIGIFLFNYRIISVNSKTTTKTI
ncbi:hypothetical protein TI03_04455 [Achromatium sp. WMS1]|nr:hypothetical protein TI03_04455 [Achromatium sp. WMS1]